MRKARWGGLVALLIAVAATVGYVVVPGLWRNPGDGTPTAAANTEPTPSFPRDWVAVAPGRVEPKSGEFHLGASEPFRIAEVLVRPHDRVATGDLLVRLDDRELRARLRAAEAEVVFRKTERDNALGDNGAAERHAAEDAVTSAEQALSMARGALDSVTAALRNGTVSTADRDRARSSVVAAETRLGEEKNALRTVLVMAGSVPPSRTESALAIARAELSVAQAALDKTQIRAPFAGNVLQVTKKPGEIATPGEPIVMMGDLTSLRVRAEIDERDVTHVSAGQPVIVRVDAFGEQNFRGHVASIATLLGPRRIDPRAANKRTGENVLTVMIDLDGVTPLAPGMRADVFFAANDPERQGAKNDATQR